MLCGRGLSCVCAVCGAEAARALEAAAIEIHPSILPREDRNEESVFVDGREIQDVSVSVSGLIYLFITANTL